MDLHAIVTDAEDQSTVYGSQASSESPTSTSGGSKRSTLTSFSARLLLPGHGAASYRPASDVSRNTSRSEKRRLDVVRPVQGWPTLADDLANMPDLESFRRFRRLNVKTLLYYQAELTELEETLEKTEREDAAKPGLERFYGSSAEQLLQTLKRNEPITDVQCSLVLRIRELLRDYNTALLQHAKISALPYPVDDNVQNLRRWIKKTGVGDPTVGLQGVAKHTWGDTEVELPERGSLTERFFPLWYRLFVPKEHGPSNLDLIALQQSKPLDGFTRWVSEEWIPWWDDLTHKKSDYVRSTCVAQFLQTAAQADEVDQVAVTRYSKSAMLKFTTFIATVIACLLPTLAIVILTRVESMGRKLGLIAGFTALFSIGLIWLTDAATSRVQIFAATAAFSAVLVVFVQSQ